MEFESLIFDIDGTLWDSRKLVADGYNIQLHEEGLDHLRVCAEGLTPLFGKTKEDLADALFGSLPQEERLPLMDRCMERERQYLEENDCAVGYPAVKETLETLKKKYRLFIVSNCEKGYPEICMDKMGLESLFTAHMCYGDTRTCKGETILRLMRENQITSACYIGDTQGDADAAALAKIPFVYCTYGFGNVKEYWKSIGTFADLNDIF